VEQRVVEDDAGLADARGGIDQGDLAEAAGAVVDRELGVQGVLAVAGAGLDDLPARHAQLEALDDRPAQRERHRAAYRALRALAVRAGEDLLGGEVRRVDLAVDGALSARQPVRALDQPDLEVGPRAAVAQRGEAARGQLAGPRLQLVQARG